MIPVTRILTLAALACVAVLAPSSGAAPRPSDLESLPDLVLWAWERPEDLRGIDRDLAVAFLAQTITIRPDGLHVAARRQPLRLSEWTPVIAVTRLETAYSSPGALLPGRAPEVAAAIARTAALPRVFSPKPWTETLVAQARRMATR